LQKEDIKEFHFKKSATVTAFADDQVVISITKDNLQKVASELNKIIARRGLTTSVHKTKLMVCKGRHPVRSNIVIDNRIIEQINNFNFLRDSVSYEKKWTLITICKTK